MYRVQDTSERKRIYFVYENHLKIQGLVPEVFRKEKLGYNNIDNI